MTCAEIRFLGVAGVLGWLCRFTYHPGFSDIGKNPPWGPYQCRRCRHVFDAYPLHTQRQFEIWQRNVGGGAKYALGFGRKTSSPKGYSYKQRKICIGRYSLYFLYSFTYELVRRRLDVGGGDSIFTTPILEDAEAVYPCRCGETHQGPYAIHDYMHHNCLHPGPLVFLLHEVPGCENVHNVYCPTCGKTWEVTDDLR